MKGQQSRIYVCVCVGGGNVCPRLIFWLTVALWLIFVIFAAAYCGCFACVSGAIFSGCARLIAAIFAAEF